MRRLWHPHGEDSGSTIGEAVLDQDLPCTGVLQVSRISLFKRVKDINTLFSHRNGNPLLYEGDLQNEESVLEWLIDDENRELADEIEEVNDRMLDRLMDESHLLVVFFCKHLIFQLNTGSRQSISSLPDGEECDDCEEIMEVLEQIDGEADLFGIDFVKIASDIAMEKYEIINIPSLVYFRLVNAHKLKALLLERPVKTSCPCLSVRRYHCCTTGTCTNPTRSSPG